MKVNKCLVQKILTSIYINAIWSNNITFLYIVLTFESDKDPVSELGNLRVADPGVVATSNPRTASLRNLKSLILLTYYDDDVHIQTCDEKLLMTTLQGNVKLLFCNLRFRR